MSTAFGSGVGERRVVPLPLLLQLSELFSRCTRGTQRFRCSWFWFCLVGFTQDSFLKLCCSCSCCFAFFSSHFSSTAYCCFVVFVFWALCVSKSYHDKNHRLVGNEMMKGEGKELQSAGQLSIKKKRLTRNTARSLLRLPASIESDLNCKDCHCGCLGVIVEGFRLFL